MRTAGVNLGRGRGDCRESTLKLRGTTVETVLRGTNTGDLPCHPDRSRPHPGVVTHGGVPGRFPPRWCRSSPWATPVVSVGSSDLFCPVAVSGTSSFLTPTSSPPFLPTPGLPTSTPTAPTVHGTVDTQSSPDCLPRNLRDFSGQRTQVLRDLSARGVQCHVWR